MSADTTPRSYGRFVYGLGVMHFGVLGFVVGDFLPGQPVPKALPGHTQFAYAAAAIMLLGGLAAEGPKRVAAWGGAVLTVYFALIVVVLMNGPVILAHYAVYGAYSGAAMRLAMAAGALLIYAAYADITPANAARTMHIARIVFGICAMLFGGAHFFYMDLTAPVVPAWLPPSQLFWATATGVAQIAAGVAIASGVQARLAAILLTIMYALFTPLVHIPQLLSDPSRVMFWNENAANLTLTGVAWLVADSLARAKASVSVHPTAA